MHRRGLYLSGDAGGGHAAPPAAPAAEPHPPAGPADPAAGTPNAGQGEHLIPKARFDEVNGELKRLRKQIEDADRERQAREDAAAREQGRFRELAEKHEARIKQLEPIQATAERYEAALKAHLDTQRRDLPPHITALLDKLDVAEQLEWIAANREALSASAGTGATPPATARAGTLPNPRPAAVAGPTPDDLKRQLLAHPRYAGF